MFHNLSEKLQIGRNNASTNIAFHIQKRDLENMKEGNIIKG